MERPVVPAARRTRFPVWPRSKLSDETREIGREGVSHAREELARHAPFRPERGAAQREDQKLTSASAA